MASLFDMPMAARGESQESQECDGVIYYQALGLVDRLLISINYHVTFGFDRLVDRD